ncbi:unnamed protein product [Effrenium voratum]|nr:unnamed protein product [Effrenium voratum]
MPGMRKRPVRGVLAALAVVVGFWSASFVGPNSAPAPAPAPRTAAAATADAEAETVDVMETAEEAEEAAAEVAEEAEVATASDGAAWRSPLRRLLLARRQKVREDALKELAGIYDQASEQIFKEVERYGEAGGLASSLRLRPFFGYRSACASLYRTVRDHILPQQAGSPVVVSAQTRDGAPRLRYVLQTDAMDADGREASEEEAVSEASKARALFVALRQLPQTNAWTLERSAGSAETVEEWSKRTPKLETPKYKVISRDALFGFEVREYEPYAVVQTQQGTEAANNRSFFMLADYIFGKKNERKEKMAMTTPVQMDRDTGSMSFIMPSKYWTSLEDAPQPDADAGVLLEPRPRERLAVSVFGGYALGPRVARKTEELIDFVQKSEAWELAENSTRLMQYNDPFTVPWKRRNEVSVPVRPKVKA